MREAVERSVATKTTTSRSVVATRARSSIAKVRTVSLEWLALSKYARNAPYGRLYEKSVLLVPELLTFFSWSAAQDPIVGASTSLADYDDSCLIRRLLYFCTGNWLLGGQLLQNRTVVNIAHEVNKGCWNAFPR
ncbi:hypothetical protein B0H12DRAFT_1069839 [Mycena haematopus]|nr:hypothetical protein B0H12DRAFT_1069839 [Mycena haematopus]